MTNKIADMYSIMGAKWYDPFKIVWNFIIGKKAGIHPVLVMLGVLGGLAIFGFIGFVIGPLILAMFMTFLEIYEDEKISSKLRV